jgi:cyclase
VGLGASDATVVSGAVVERPPRSGPEQRGRPLRKCPRSARVVLAAAASLTKTTGRHRPTLARRNSRHFRLETLAPGVHAAVATPEGHGLCNAGIVDLGGETVVFDTMLTPAAGADLARAAERLTGRRPGFVVNSHWHGDHIWGNASFVGAHIVSSRTVRATILRRSRQQFEDDRKEMRRALPRIDAPSSPYARRDRPMVRGWFHGVVTMPTSFRVVPPDLTFEDRFEISGSRRAIELVTYGGGHSPSDVFAFLPEERILFAGDLALRGLHPSVGDGWPDRWVPILRRMERLGATTVLPGHGPPGPGTTLAANRRYLSNLQRVVRRARAAGASLAELLQRPVPRPYRGWGFSLMYAPNLQRTYRLHGPARGRRPE